MNVPPPAISIARNGPIAVVRLTTPAPGGAPSTTLADRLREAAEQLAGDDTLRAAVLTGDAWSLDSGVGPPPAAGHAGPASVVAAIAKPTIAFIDSDCLDEALELALACDVRYARETSRFAMRHVRRGTLPHDGGTQRLARAVGRGHALRLLLTAEVIDAHEAARIGLVQRVGTLQDAMDWAERAAEGAPIAAAFAKEAAMAAFDLTLDRGLRVEADLSLLLHSTADRAEGLASFREKRPPRFEGR